MTSTITKRRAAFAAVLSGVGGVLFAIPVTYVAVSPEKATEQAAAQAEAQAKSDHLIAQLAERMTRDEIELTANTDHPLATRQKLTPEELREKLGAHR
ncbi:hypothetical protein [Segniliparus rugosus]|uniref:Uncharacterized protein n=1 Tax=Segniliparus rugosus (strain ATCC BAA-974 / DSM 45345 / CCUG 50838 / CIP 108380 / JCM 13579 / CDC 945) TaxID=679197 RepID=E5XLP2_SEGRC|nr:hypothetical protein [Segniliparus rugosus]EFV14720.1 hypothetical protein HMPREF9336_00411 [Segniliparus rugosus ATCC BAA-974]